MDNFYSNLCIVIYIMLWFWVFLKQKKKGFGASAYLSLLFLTWAISALFLYNNDLRNSFGELTLFPFLYLFTSVIIFMWPSIKYDTYKNVSIQCPSDFLVISFFIIYGLCSLIALPIIITQLRTNFTLILLDSSAGDLLYQMNMKNATTGNGITGLLGYAALIRNFFRECFIFLLFYYMTKRNRIRILTKYLIMVLVLDIFSALVSGGRTSFTMMMFAVGSAYFIFRDYWDDKMRKIIKIFGLMAGLGFLFIFITLTVSRFSANNYTNSPLWSILSYLGQSPLYFNQHGLNADGIRYGDRTVNSFKALLGMNPPTDFFEVRSKYSYMSMNDSVFYTFVGDFTLDFGPLIAFVIFAVYSIWVTRCTRIRNKRISFHKLLLVYFTACVCSQGSMYLFYYSFVQNWTMVAFALMYFIFYLDYALRKSHRYIEKNYGRT